MRPSHQSGERAGLEDRPTATVSKGPSASACRQLLVEVAVRPSKAPPSAELGSVEPASLRCYRTVQRPGLAASSRLRCLASDASEEAPSPAKGHHRPALDYHTQPRSAISSFFRFSRRREPIPRCRSGNEEATHAIVHARPANQSAQCEVAQHIAKRSAEFPAQGATAALAKGAPTLPNLRLGHA